VRDALGERWGARLLKQLGDAPALVFDLVGKYGMDCQAVRNGTLHCAVGSSGLDEIAERARQWQQLGAPVRVLDRTEAARATGCDAYRGALLDLRAGTIQPLAYARELARAAVTSGAKIFTGTRVTGSEDHASHWLLHTSAGGTVEAKWVIVATETYTRPDGAWSGIGSELVRLPYFNLATAPLPAELAARILPERQGAWDTAQVLSSFRLDRHNRLVFGSVGALRGTGHAVHRAWAQRALARLFPELRGVAFEHEWYGWIGMTSDALPRFHRFGRNTVGFAGYNGRGIAPGTSFGRDLARLALGEIGEADLPLPVSDVAPAPLRSVKESLYEAGSVLSHWAAARL
jgi:glycine/D-amino acid oxidase-like deaminating enzyme